MATKKKARKKAATKKAPAKKRSKALARPSNDLRKNLEAQMDEVRQAVDELGKEFQVFRDGITRSSRALLQGVAGFREALAGANPLTPFSLKEAARRLTEGVQRFVRALQGN